MIETLQAIGGTLWEFIAGIVLFVIYQTIDNFNAVVTGFSKGGRDSVEALFPLAILILQFYLLIATIKVLKMIWFLLREMQWHVPKSYSALREGGKRILIVGDSTAYGRGADKPEDSIAGHLGHDFPGTEIVNKAVNGSLTRHAIAQLARAGAKPFDMIIICTGGNDIWHFTRLVTLEQSLNRLLKDAAEKCDRKVIVLFYANLGSAPVFPPAIRWILSKRTQKVHSIFVRQTALQNVPLIELYTGATNRDIYMHNPFLEDPKQYYAKDRMHPNSNGYRLWYKLMWYEMVKNNYLFSERGRPATEKETLIAPK